MGFLDGVLNKNNEAAAEAVKKPNPLAVKKPNPLAARKPSVPLKPTAKKEAEVAKEVVEEIVETTTEATELATETEAKEVTQATVEAEAQPEEEPKTEETTETKEQAEEEASPKTEPEAKPKNRRKQKASPQQNNDEEKTFFEMPTTQMDYAEAVEAVRSPFTDEKWESFKEEIINDMNSIQLTDDMNAGTLKVVSAELSILRDKIYYPLFEAKTDAERYAMKEPEGLIERVKRINSTGGSNDIERRRNGILACVAYETSAGTVNLYELMDEARSRYAFLRAIDESIKFKKDLLITMSSSLKLEKELL